MPLVKTEIADQIAIIKFDDPTTLNAMSVPMVEEFSAALGEVSKSARALVVTGEGRAFCSGAALTGGGNVAPTTLVTGAGTTLNAPWKLVAH